MSKSERGRGEKAGGVQSEGEIVWVRAGVCACVWSIIRGVQRGLVCVATYLHVLRVMRGHWCARVCCAAAARVYACRSSKCGVNGIRIIITSCGQCASELVRGAAVAVTLSADAIGAVAGRGCPSGEGRGWEGAVAWCTIGAQRRFPACTGPFLRRAASMVGLIAGMGWRTTLSSGLATGRRPSGSTCVLGTRLTTIMEIPTCGAVIGII